MFKQNYTPAQFTDLANYILNNIIISANGTRYRICEIEFYYHNETHLDEYVHQSPDQKQYGKFYFHKFHNGTYKAGTFKGLDITLGNENTYFGILIRSIKNMETNEFTEGSCNVANKILGCFNVSNVKELFEIHYPEVVQISITDNKLKLEKMDLDKEDIYKGPRIGLSDKYPDFKDKNYRYCTFLKNIKKQKKTMKKIKMSDEEYTNEPNDIFLVVLDGEPTAFYKQADAQKFIKSQGEEFKGCKYEKENYLFYHNDVDGYDNIEFFTLDNKTNKVYILSFYYDKGYCNEKMFYADSYEKILDVAKKEINYDFEIINENYQEYCDDLPDEDSEEIIQKYNKKYLDPDYAFQKLKKNNLFEMREISGEHIIWKIYFIDIN